MKLSAIGGHIKGATLSIISQSMNFLESKSGWRRHAMEAIAFHCYERRLL
jgi:hypothetical protein